jgi:hypothetical protein
MMSVNLQVLADAVFTEWRQCDGVSQGMTAQHRRPTRNNSGHGSARSRWRRWRAGRRSRRSGRRAALPARREKPR